jgi:Pyruvate/2-oxoacid:ferredoxin oxidoreductase delta subunit
MPVAFPATESGVELRILARLFTPLEARVALCLSALAEPLSTIHRRIRHELDAETLRETLQTMAEHGLIECDRTPRGLRYGKSMFVVGIYERQVGRLSRELEQEILQYFEEAFGRAVHSKKTPQLRTVPVNRTIPAERGVASYDDIRAFASSAAGPFAVMNCICREGKHLVGEPCRQTALRETCLTFGEGARGMMAQGAARPISRGEVLAVLDQADREGLVLQPQNTRNPLFVCCCCGCCCGVLTMAKRLPVPASYFSSNFRAEVNAGECIACGECATRCQMDAIADDGLAVAVDEARCIGCGLCVSACASSALSLTPKAERTSPPKNLGSLYAKIYYERHGALGLMRAVGLNLLGRKV